MFQKLFLNLRNSGSISHFLKSCPLKNSDIPNHSSYQCNVVQKHSKSIFDENEFFTSPGNFSQKYSKIIFDNENLAIFVGTLKNYHDPPPPPPSITRGRSYIT